jgi:hypothetical protein
LKRVVKTETQEEEEGEVEEEQQEPPEPKVPPPTQVSMECQTDESFLGHKLEALCRKRNQFHLKALCRKRNQGNHKQNQKEMYKRMTQLKNKNLPKDSTMVVTSLEFSFSKTWRLFFRWLS